VSDAAYIQTARDWLARTDLVILDTETTGLDPAQHEIIDLAVLSTQGEILLETLIKPNHVIQEVEGDSYETEWGEERYRPSAFQINGISNAMVRYKPTIYEVWNDLFSMVQGKTVLCYNATFDCAMLAAEQQRYELESAGVLDWIDLMQWYADYVDTRRWVSLGEACEMENVGMEAALHTAMGDCQAALAVLRAIAAKALPMGIENSKPVEEKS
jgi:DNA polymerase-3 subunit epsilon